MTPLVVRYRRGLGDAVLLTAVARDLALRYPGKYDLWCDTGHPEVWLNNPYAKYGRPIKRPRFFDMRIESAINNRKKHPKHIMAAMFTAVSLHLGKPLSPTLAEPDLHFVEPSPVAGDYWVLVAGGRKKCMTKLWRPSFYQRLVDLLAGEVRFVTVGAVGGLFINYPLTGVEDRVGRTNVRELLSLIAHSRGVVCGYTGALHIAAAYGRPCVVVGGGRESREWEHYASSNLASFGPNCRPPRVDHVLFDGGDLACRDCFKNNVAPPPKPPLSLCLAPLACDDGLTASCMAAIPPEKVATEIRRIMGVEGGAWPASH